MTSRRIIQRGHWLYDGSTPVPATIIALDYDFWYEIGRADGDLDPDEAPALNADGLLYYVCFKSDPVAHPGWVDSQGFQDVGARPRLGGGAGSQPDPVVRARCDLTWRCS